MGRRAAPEQPLLAHSGPKRGLSREEAADYVGVSATKFTALVADGRMPKPIPIDSRRIWDIHDLDHAFNALKSANDDNEPNSWDEVT